MATGLQHTVLLCSDGDAVACGKNDMGQCVTWSIRNRAERNAERWSVLLLHDMCHNFLGYPGPDLGNSGTPRCIRGCPCKVGQASCQSFGTLGLYDTLWL